jgi:hypothetical protein
MERREGVPVVKFMMLLSSMTPLFLLIGLRGIAATVISDRSLWIIIGIVVILPFLFLYLRIQAAIKSNNVMNVDTTDNSDNKDYLFTYLFTVLLPMYSFTITNCRDAFALLFALIVVLFVLWNMNLHFINIFFAIQGYKVYTLNKLDGAILLSVRHNLPVNAQDMMVHRISNSVFIEIKNHNYGI